MDFQREPQSKHHLYFLDCFFFPLGQPDLTRPLSLTLTQTPTPADRVVPIHSWRPLGYSTVWADFVCVSAVRFCIWCVPNLRSKDPWQ